MDKKNLLIAGGLIGGLFICLFLVLLLISANLILVSEMLDPSEYNVENASFNNSTPELTAVSVARLNFGVFFNEVSVDDVYLTDDGKYWIVGIDTNDKTDYLEVTVDAKTLMSKRSDGGWRSLDDLKARYIAEIQSPGQLGKPQKITIDGKEVWKVPVSYTSSKGDWDVVEYVYVDLTTGKSKNTLDEFNMAAGTDNWLTLSDIDKVIDKAEYYPNQFPFKDVLRDLYPEYSNSSYNPPEYWLSFDNLTPEMTAISIARLNRGVYGFAYRTTANASLTHDKKYWIVEMYQDGSKFNEVKVANKTWMSKDNNSNWTSLDELKALYIAELRLPGEESMGKPQKVTIDGKEIWKVPIYGPVINALDEYTGETELVGYIYVDLATGKSKREGNIFDIMVNILQGNPDGWLTLKEVDEQIHENYLNSDYPPLFSGPNLFKDALRDLYYE